MSDELTAWDYFSLIISIAVYIYIFVKLEKIDKLEKEIQQLKRKLRNYE